MKDVTRHFDDETAHSLDPNFVLEVWHRRKWIGLATFAAVFAGAVTLALSLPDLYRAKATVLVDRQEVSETFVRSSVTADLGTRIQTIRQRLMSRARLEDVISRLNLYPELRNNNVPLEAVVERMRRDIDLQLEGVDQAGGHATIAFALLYSGRDPRTVANVANTLVAYYVEENTQSRERQAARTAEFLAAQVADVKRELDEQERRTSEFARLHTNEMPEQLAANSAALDRLNAQLRLNGDYQLRNMERRERLESELADPGASSPEPPTPAAQLVKLKRELVELRRQFTDQYPDVIRANAQIAALEKELAQKATVGRGATAPSGPVARREQSLAEVDRELRSLKQEEAALKRTILAYEARVDGAPKRQREMEELSRGQQSTRDRYQALVKQYEDAKLAANLEQGKGAEQLRILDPAIPPIMPAAPNRLWLLVMGLVASVALGACAIVAAERLDTTFHTAEDLRSFVNVPVLATIRRIVTKTAARRQRRRLALMAGAAAVGLALIIAGTHYIAAGNEQIVRLTARGGV